VGVYSTLSAGSLVVVALGGAILAVALMTLGLVLRWPSTIPWSVLLAAGSYLSARAGHSVVDGWASLIGVLLLLAAELATWSIEHDARIRTERALVLHRAFTLAALVAVAALVNFVVLATTAVTTGTSVLLAAVGVAAAVSAVAIVLRLLRA
jgi:hypothetical protein